MTLQILAIGAVVGGIIGICAYLPQFWHLVKVKDSTGQSMLAWYSWLIGNALLLAYAIAIKNSSYIIVEALYFFANLIMIILIYKYKKNL